MRATDDRIGGMAFYAEDGMELQPLVPPDAFHTLGVHPPAIRRCSAVIRR
jgi:hypothetical protein